MLKKNLKKLLKLLTLLTFIFSSTNILSQGLSTNSCPEIEKRNNGNGQAAAAAGNFTPFTQNNLVAPNVVGTQYQNVPYDPSSKTGNYNFKWASVTPITNLPVVTRVWTTNTSGVTILSPIVFGPPPPSYFQGGAYYANYCFYVQNMPPAGRVTLEFTDPQTSIPAFRCTYDLQSGSPASEPAGLSCTPTITSHPVSQQFCGNGSVTFTSAATSFSSSKWQISSNGGSSWTDISLGGNFTTVNSTTLTISNRSSYNGNLFRSVYTGTCGSTNSSNATLTINPLPTAAFINNASLCGLNVQRSLGVTFTGTGPWSFTFTTNGTSTTLTNISSNPYYFSVTPSVATTYIITSVSDSKCTNSSLTGNTTIVVNAPPTVTPSNASVCTGSNSFSLTNSSTGSPTQYAISTGTRVLTGFSAVSNQSISSPITVTIPASGYAAGVYDFNILVTNTNNGCSSSLTPFTLTVNSLPTVGATASSGTICAGTTTTLSASPSNLSSYDWRISPSSTVIGSSVSYIPTVNATTTYTVTGTNSNGCSSTADVTVTTTSGNPITITPSSTTICSGNAAIILASGANSYLWSPSTGLSSTTDDEVVASPPTTTTYTVTAQNITGCQSIGTIKVTVTNAPITVSSSTTICSGASVIRTASGGSTYFWYPNTGLFTDAGCTVSYAGTNLATVYSKPTSTTTYFVSGTTAGGCNGIASTTVTLETAPINSATSTPNNLIFCTQGANSFPLNVVMNQAVTSATWSYSTTGTSYTTFSTATSLSGVTVTPSSSGASPTITYTCTLSGYGNSGYGGARYFRLTIVGSSCTFNYDILITDTKSTATTPAPTASQTTICSGNFVTLSIGALAAGSTMQWESSPNNSTWTAISGATSASYTTGTLTANTFYRVVYNGGTGNCGSTTTSTQITVVSALSANTLSPASTCSYGSGTITLTGTAISGGIYQWQYSTTSSSTGFIDVLGATSQNYTLPNNIVSTSIWYRRIATNGTCLTNTSAAIVVTPPVTGNYTSTSTINYCNGTSPAITLTGTTPTGGDGSFLYTWESSTNGTTFTTILGATSINYTTSIQTQSYWYKRLVRSGSCTGDYSNTIKITVNANPIVTVTASATICSGSSRTLTATGAVSYSWSPSTYLSSISGTSVVSSPTANATYTVTGTDANGCTNTANTTVTVTNLPSTPTLSSSSKTICSNQTQSLNSLVTSGGSYTWYTVPEVNATYAVSSPTSVSTGGTFYVFNVTSGCYSTNAASFNLTVADVTAPIVNATSFNVCAPNTVNLQVLEPIAATNTTLEWHTGNTSGSPIVASPTSVSTGTYYLFAKAGGASPVCFGSASSAVSITVNSLPTVSTSPSTLSVCSPSTIDLTSTTSNVSNVEYKWYTQNDSPPNVSYLIQNPSIIGASDTYYVHAFNTVTGCISSSPASVGVTIKTVPVLSFVAPEVACAGNAVDLEVAVTNVVSSPTYQWQIYNSTNQTFENLSNGGIYSGATSNILSISSNTGMDGSAYKCVVSSSGCSAASSIGVIGVSLPNVPTTAVTQPNCYVSTGTIEVTSYALDLLFSLTAPTNFQSSTLFENVNTGSYTLTVKDVLNCTNSTSVTINPQPLTPDPPSATVLSECVYNNPASYVTDVNGFTSPLFKWYLVQTSDTTSSSYEQRSTSTTYSSQIMETTTFYVSVLNPSTLCESARTVVLCTVIDPLGTYDPSVNDYIWKGGAVADDNDWNTLTNWYQFDGTKYITVNAIPSTNDNVFIPPTGTCTPAQPHVQNENTQQFVNLTIKSGGTLTIEGNGILNVSGNWVNNGTFVKGSGVVNFTGSGNHTISGSTNTSFNNVVVNKPLNGSNKSTLTLQQQITINGELTLTAGLFDIATYSIDMGNRSINGGSNASYVRTSSSGFLRRIVGANGSNNDGSHVRFPIGRSNYNPAHLNNSGTDDTFSLRVYDLVSDNADENGTMTSLPVVERTWLIEEATIGGSNVDLQLYWNGTLENRFEELNSFDYNTAYVAHYNSSQVDWEDKGGSAPGGPGYAQTNNISNFSPFTISSGSNGLGRYNPLPVVLLNFSATCIDDNTVNVKWSTASENNSSYFLVEKSIDGSSWESLSTETAAGNSTSILNYSLIDNRINKSNNYYRLTQFDLDGKNETFNIVIANCSSEIERNQIGIFPNPSDEKFYINLRSQDIEGNGLIQITDTKGSIVFSKNVTIEKGENLFTVDELKVQSGIYYVTVSGENFSTKVMKQFIK